MKSKWRVNGRWRHGEEYLITFADSGVEAWTLLADYLVSLTSELFDCLHVCTLEEILPNEDGYKIINIANRKELVMLRNSKVRGK